MKKAVQDRHENFDVKREETQKEIRRNIIIGHILQKIHKKQGTMGYLLEVIEPYLTKDNRKLFGLPF